jgi:hypothetical protein
LLLQEVYQHSENEGESIMTTKHTAGPWCNYPDGKYDYTLSPAGNVIATVGGKTHDYRGEKQRFNAHLIASAPELLEALKDCRVALTFYREWMHKHTVTNQDDEPGTNYPFGDQCENKSRQAIAKAEGK